MKKTMGTSYANNRQQTLVNVVTSGTMLHMPHLTLIPSFVALIMSTFILPSAHKKENIAGSQH